MVHYLTDNSSIGEAICNRADELKVSTLGGVRQDTGPRNHIWMLQSRTRATTLFDPAFQEGPWRSRAALRVPAHVTLCAQLGALMIS